MTIDERVRKLEIELVDTSETAAAQAVFAIQSMDAAREHMASDAYLHQVIAGG